MTQLSHSHIPVTIRVTQSVNKSLNNFQFYVSTKVSHLDDLYNLTLIGFEFIASNILLE